MRAVRAPTSMLPLVDQLPTEPDHGHRGEVHHDHDHRKHARNQERGLEVVRGQPPVRRCETGNLMLLPDKAPDDVGAYDLFAEDPGDAVDESLPLPVERDEATHDQVHDEHQHRDYEDHDGGQGRILLDGQDNSPDAHDRCRSEHGEDQNREGLDLLDVIGGPGDEAGGPERADLLGGHCLDLGEKLPSQAVADLHGDVGPEVPGSQGGRGLHSGEDHHPAAKPQDYAGLVGEDSVVDDARVQRRQQQVSRGLHHLQHDDRPDSGPVLAEEAEH
jgi:hypothetical protein